MRFLTQALLALALALPAAAEPAKNLDSEGDKIVYALGWAMAQQIQGFYLTPEEIEIVRRGMDDAFADREAAVDYSVYGTKISQFAKDRSAAVAAKEKEASKAFLAQEAKVPGAVMTDSGLVYTETRAGTGDKPKPTDTVTVHYHGTLRDGTVFDSSRGKEPRSFPLNRVIPCWTEALQMMSVGGAAAITCPAETAYGDAGWGKIKPGSALHFEVELIAIK